MATTAARTSGTTAARDLRDTVSVGNLEVDRAPVTNRRYAVFVAATGHRPPLTWPRGECPEKLLDHPVTGVDFFDALAFALWTDAALPTEEQWIAAAGLTEPSAYVWGDFFDAKRCNTAKSGIKGTTPVGAYAAGTAPSGAVDLCGNVWEMTCTAFAGDTDAIIVKGGSWADLPAHARLDTQFKTRVNKGSATVGFRLVYGVPGYLPHFLDRDLVDQCISFRKADAPHFDAAGDEAEFEAIVESLRESAGPHLAKVLSEGRVALVGSETGARRPPRPRGSWGASATPSARSRARPSGGRSSRSCASSSTRAGRAARRSTASAPRGRRRTGRAAGRRSGRRSRRRPSRSSPTAAARSARSAPRSAPPSRSSSGPAARGRGSRGPAPRCRARAPSA